MMQLANTEPQKRNTFFNPISIRSALSGPRRAIDFVLPGLPTGHLGAIVGQGGSGKGWLALQLAVCYSCGLPSVGGLFPAPASPAPVVLVAAEDDAEMLVDRLRSVVDHLMSSADLSPRGDVPRVPGVVELLERNLTLVSTRGKKARIDDANTAFYDELSEGCKGSRLVIIDPLRRLHDGDENDSKVMTTVCERLEAICASTGAAMLITHHTNKHTDGTIQQAVRGSSALTDAIRWQMNLNPMSEKEGEQYEVPVDLRRGYVRVDITKTNYGPPLPTRWLRRAESGALKLVASMGPKEPAKRQGGRHGR